MNGYFGGYTLVALLGLVGVGFVAVGLGANRLLRPWHLTEAKLLTYEWAEYRKRAKGGEHQVVMFGWSGDNGDPDNFFVPLLGCEAVKGGGNVARWCNKQFEDLVIKAAQTPKQADRAKLYEQAQMIFKEEAPWITIAHSVRFDPIRKEVKGYKMDATAHHYFDKSDIVK